jgi:NADPH-dependent 2,4-dienoyl-CoA reductase/sulfur reductase-like enzyme
MVRGAEGEVRSDDMSIQRREFLKALGAAGFGTAVSALPGCATTGGGARGKVVVVGGGYGGATAAKYIRMWSDGAVDVTIVEPNAEFISCPMSNLVLGGSKDLAYLTVGYANLTARHGVKMVRDTATAVDTDKRVVKLASGSELPYDRLVLSPAIDFMWDKVPSLNNADAQAKILHAWKAGAQTVALRNQLVAMADGGVCAISIPVAPYRCPPGPYERACQIAWYFKRAKPKSKVLILDGNGDVTSKGPLFKKAWAEEYKGIVEYRPNHVLTDVDVATRTAKFDVHDSVKADVLNVIPPQRAAAVARSAGVVTANDRWCDVDFLTFESIKVKNVHVLGDAIQIATGMPKSGHMANQHAKVCAAAVVALLAGQPPNPTPVLTNTCYSMITDKDSVHVCSVHQYDAEKKTVLPVPGSGGVSTAMNAVEGAYAAAWAMNIWADMLA